MQAFYADEQRRHYPERFLVNGVFKTNPERPERVDLLLDGARAAGCEIVRPPECGLDPVLAVHEARYVEFLRTAHERWSRIEGAADAVTPNIHPVARSNHYPASVVAQAGWHMLDVGAPVAASTFDSALWSAASAVAAANAVLGGEPSAYALCRPPGHHAHKDAAAGFCYFNNSAIAAVSLRSKYEKVAVLDVDLHHGNGTQDIFYQRADVLTVSVHANPKRFYPFFWGAAGERGAGAGRGFNLNLPLDRGAGDDAFLAALDAALQAVRDFRAGALVVALGLDAYEGDPFGGLKVTTRGFRSIGAAVSTLELPAVLVQEGGYVCDALGRNLTAFLTGYSEAKEE